MKGNICFMLYFLAFFSVASFVYAEEQEDSYLWLEEIEGKKALEWVHAHNERTTGTLKSHPEFNKINRKIIEILNSKDRIAYPSIRGEYVYNFWQDAANERGILRRALLTDYIGNTPQWETVLDLDCLSKEEDEKWAFKGASFLYPEFERCMLRLSRGGSDAVVIREFDLLKKEFVKTGFSLPEAKGYVSWIDKDTLIASTNFGKGSTTTSGYPRIIKVWKRGTPLSEAKILYEGEDTNVAVSGYIDHTPERQYIIVSREMTFYTSRIFILEQDRLIKLDIPEDSQFHGFFRNRMLIELKSDWAIDEKTYNQGSLISIEYDKFLRGDRNFRVIFEPDSLSSLAEISKTAKGLLINRLTNVSSELYEYTLNNNEWISRKIGIPDYGAVSIISNDEFSGRYFISYENFLTPVSLFFADDDKKLIKIKSLPNFFNSDGFEVMQMEAMSTDNTKIPYFVVIPKDTRLDGSNPTLLYGYGGFEISMQPGYSATIGSSWLEKGGVYALANIRGGGEFGPKWHRAALKENRQRSFDDFIAVSEDLIKRKITSPNHLGIMGGSNGGLLVGAAFTQRPDLYNAAVCSVPLLDMKRYNKLLAGASWMAEYGNPDMPEEWQYIKKYSPFHNISAAERYPKVFFTTTTRDDRVHPGHARKMAAKMEDLGHDFFYFENTEGGHGAGVTNEQRAFMTSLEFTYLLMMLR